MSQGTKIQDGIHAQEEPNDTAYPKHTCCPGIGRWLERCGECIHEESAIDCLDCGVT